MENITQNNLGANDRMHDEWLLPNGLRVVGERLPYLRSVSVGAWMHVGSMMELPEESGLSHFLEHMVFKGTEKRTARQIAEEMDAVGGQLNAFTGRDCTCFYAKVIDENLELAVDILSDLVIHATMDPVELEKERGVILEEISMDEDSPEDLVHDLLQTAQFGTQSPGQPILKKGSFRRFAAYTGLSGASSAACGLFTLEAKHGFVHCIYSLIFENSAVGGKGDNAPGNELFAVEQGVPGCKFDAAAAGNFHSYHGKALDIVVLQDSS